LLIFLPVRYPQTQQRNWETNRLNRTDHPCGAQDPTRVNTSTISTSTSAGSSGTGSAGSATSTGFGAFGGAGGTTATSTSTTAAKSAAIAALNLGNTYGFAVVVSGMFAGFAMML
jgi:hypothetical protein